MNIGDKIRVFGESKFGSITDLSRALEIPLQNLYPYLTNKSEPGAKLLKKLHRLGCDLNWLLEEEQGKVKEPALSYNIDREVQQLRTEIKELKKAIASIEKIIQQTKGK